MEKSLIPKDFFVNNDVERKLETIVKEEAGQVSIVLSYSAEAQA